MKRARRAPAMFGSESDSEDSAENRRARLRLIAEPDDGSGDEVAKKVKAPSAASSKVIEEDSLETFMSNLKNEPLKAPRPQGRTGDIGNHSESGEDLAPPDNSGGVLQGEGSSRGYVSALEDERTGEHPARDLILDPIDHSSKNYPAIQPCNYAPLPKLANLSHHERKSRLLTIGGSVYGGEDIVPVDAFQDLALTMPRSLLGAILTDFKSPTPVQKISIPAALYGRDIIGVAKTGSGKTAAYTIPLLMHISAQVPGSSTGGKGPSALIIAPTRELATQISGVVQRFAKTLKIGVICVVGGHAKYEQFKRLRDSGAEIVVCTPGRLIDMIKMKACSFARCSFVVLDEADRMFDMGFGNQVDSLLSQIRPDSQKLLFSATFPKRVESLAKKYLTQPVRIVIGSVASDAVGASGEEMQGKGKERSASARTTAMVSENISESYIVVSNEVERESWLLGKLKCFMEEGLVIVFCQTRGGSAALANRIRGTGIPAACVHGETDHADREGLLKMFRAGELRLLVTTDMSARGLDILNIRNVVNYECAKSWDWHVHRVGRTGRAKMTGKAYTLICRTSRTDLAFVDDALAAFRKAQLPAPLPLRELGSRTRLEGDRTPTGRGRRRNSRY